MTELKIELTEEQTKRMYALMKKYGFKEPDELIKFLVKIFDQGYVEFLWGKNRYEQAPF